jgi:hypothetical protein
MNAEHTVEQVASVTAQTEVNSREIDKLRERSHEFGNELQRAIAVIENVNGKLDAIHLSLKSDIAVLDGKVSETNGRVKKGELADARLRGMAIVFAAAAPFLVTVVGVVVAHFIH